MRTWLGKKERNGFAFQNEKERIERDRVFGAERRATKLTEFKRRHLIGENAYRCVVLIGFPDSIFVFRDSASMSEKRGKKRQPRNRYPGCSRDPGKWRRSCGRTESSSRIESTRQNDYPLQSRRRPQTRRNQGIETLADGLVV